MFRRQKAALSSLSRTRTTGSLRSNVGALFGLVLLLAALFLWFNRQYVIDLVDYTQYRPVAAISAIAKRTTMNDTGKFYFYASRPVLDKTQTFNKECDRKEASSAILGCYVNNRIFLYDVNDERLDGIREVTAAHETLHAVYQRMGDGEKSTINALLEKEYAKHQNDKELTDRMAFYERNEVGERDNELHSIIGTEFSGLDPALEAHYAQYFTNRKAIVDLHTKYASVFLDLQSKTSQLSLQLQDLGKQIQTESATYNTDVKLLNRDIEQFNSRASSPNSFASIQAFNNERDALVGRVNTLDAKRTSIDNDLALYEKLRKEYNATADTSKQLYDSIDSSLAPAPSI
jgi:hypothetical protein